MPNETVDNTDNIPAPSDTISYAIDCNDDSHLLEATAKENTPEDVDNRPVIPSTTAIHSLFSENQLLLDQD